MAMCTSALHFSLRVPTLLDRRLFGRPVEIDNQTAIVASNFGNFRKIALQTEIQQTPQAIEKNMACSACEKDINRKDTLLIRFIHIPHGLNTCFFSSQNIATSLLKTTLGLTDALESHYGHQREMKFTHRVKPFKRAKLAANIFVECVLPKFRWCNK